jgi:mRNA interferase MazF
MTASDYLPNTGDLIWTDFDPTKGREQAGRSLALVVSPATFTENTGLAIVFRIASQSTSITRVLPQACRCGEIDRHPQHRHSGPACRYVRAAVSTEVARLVRAKLGTFITI